jgi:hypothetical protein
MSNKKPKAPPKASAVENLIETLTMAALDLLDADITDWQRWKAEEIYALCNTLELGEDA